MVQVQDMRNIRKKYLTAATQKYEIQDLSQCDFDKLKADFRHYKGSYRYAYTIVNYVLNNYSNEEIGKSNFNNVSNIGRKIIQDTKVIDVIPDIRDFKVV